MFGKTVLLTFLAFAAVPEVQSNPIRKVTQPIGNAVSAAFSIPNKLIFHSFISTELPKDYQSLSAKEKLDILWANCIKDTKTSGHTPNHEALPVFFRDMNDTFDHISDERPWRGKKPIHGGGYVLKGRFDASADSPYTGVFKGCKNLLMRPAPGLAPKQGMLLAGISIKFLISGHPSANYVALRKWGTNTKDLNWFADLKSHLGSTIAGPIGPPLMMKFRTAGTQFGSKCGICDMGDIDEDGNVEKNPKFPFELTMTVNPKFDGMAYEDLPKIKPGSKLYDVYAREWSEESPLKCIGSVVTTSEMTTSWYGDRKLFFQHIRREKDIDQLKAACPDGKCPMMK